MELQIEYPLDYMQDLYALLGVSSDDLSEDDIITLPFAGTAELNLIELVPNAKAILEDTATAESTKIKLTIAFINLIAYYVYPSLKTKLLYSESDNKTIGTRFKDALSRDRNEFKAEAIRQISSTGISSTISGYSLFEVVTPAIDVISGV